MEERYKRVAKELGLDLDDLSFPVSAEYQNALAAKNPNIIKSMEHGILDLIAGLLKIKKYNADDFKYYLGKLNAKDISFWGERFEIYTYSKFIDKSLPNLRRGTPNSEADFVFDFQGSRAAMEVTTANFSVESQNIDAIAKIKKKIWEKNQMPYASKECCLALDITNPMFIRTILNDSSIPISKIFENLSSHYGAILLIQNFYLPTESKYVSDAYVWKNSEISDGLNKYLDSTLQPSISKGKDRLYFPRM